MDGKGKNEVGGGSSFVSDHTDLFRTVHELPQEGILGDACLEEQPPAVGARPTFHADCLRLPVHCHLHLESGASQNTSMRLT